VIDRIAGRIPVLECLRAKKRRARRLFVLEGLKAIEEIRQAAGSVPIETSARTTLDKLSGGVVHQGVILEADPLPVLLAERWCELPFSTDAIAVVLDGVQDPHNFGAIVRTAAACGAIAVVYPKDRAAPLSTAAFKSAAGAMEYIDLVQATNLSRSLEDMKRVGFWIASFDPEAEQDIWDADLRGRIALVIGSEGKGVRRLVGERCDFRLRIPLPGAIDALNASVSAAVALIECLRQRRSN
jgi:23S rRNA (guanosine2251-2'-O)-methyltransferase